MKGFPTSSVCQPRLASSYGWWMDRKNVERFFVPTGRLPTGILVTLKKWIMLNVGSHSILYSVHTLAPTRKVKWREPIKYPRYILFEYNSAINFSLFPRLPPRPFLWTKGNSRHFMSQSEGMNGQEKEKVKKSKILTFIVRLYYFFNFWPHTSEERHV